MSRCVSFLLCFFFFWVVVAVAATNNNHQSNALIDHNSNNNNLASRLHQRFLITLEKKKPRGLEDVGNNNNVDCSTAIVDWTTCLLSNCLTEMDTCEEEETIGML